MRQFMSVVVVLAAAGLSGGTACGADSGAGTGGSSGTGGGASCPTGSAACPCYGNGTCAGALTCASNVCVMLGDACQQFCTAVEAANCPNDGDLAECVQRCRTQMTGYPACASQAQAARACAASALSQCTGSGTFCPVGCDSESAALMLCMSAGGTGGVVGTGGVGGATCPTGSYGCPCYGNDTCDSSLTCAFGACIRPGTGGSGGVAVQDCGLQNATDNCANALRTACCAEFGACNQVSDCLTEWTAGQTCLVDIVDDAGAITDLQVDQCFVDSAVGGNGLVTVELNDLLGCVNSQSATSVPCTGFDVALDPGHWTFMAGQEGWQLDPYGPTPPPAGTTVEWGNTGVCLDLGCLRISVPLTGADQSASLRYYWDNPVDLTGKTVTFRVRVEEGTGGGLMWFAGGPASLGYPWDSGWTYITSVGTGAWTLISFTVDSLTNNDPTQIQSIGLQVAAGTAAMSPWTNPTVVYVDSVEIN
jgi:hypothetical protein